MMKMKFFDENGTTNLRDVASKILSAVNQMERNIATQPPSQTSSLTQTQPPRQISSPMQISQTPRPVSQIQTQISRTSRLTPSSRPVSAFNRLFQPYRKNSPSSGKSSKGRRKSTQMRQVTFTVFLSWQKRHEKCTRHRKKGRTVSCRTWGKEGNVSIYRLECRV